MSACFCMGPQNGDPVCPCRMKAVMQAPWLLRPIPVEKVEPLHPSQTRPAVYITEEDARRIAREELARVLTFVDDRAAGWDQARSKAPNEYIWAARHEARAIAAGIRDLVGSAK